MGDLLLSRPKANGRHSVRRQCASTGRGLGTRRPARPGNIIFLCERYTRARTRSAARYSILNKNAVGVILIRPFRLMDTAPTLPTHVHSGRFTLQGEAAWSREGRAALDASGGADSSLATPGARAVGARQVNSCLAPRRARTDSSKANRRPRTTSACSGLAPPGTRSASIADRTACREASTSAILA
jgi:hypothetical protein